MKTLAERLRWAREASGLTARRLDKMAELTAGHTTAIEAGRRIDPSVSTVASLATALAVPLDWLATGDGPIPSVKRLRAKHAA